MGRRDGSKSRLPKKPNLVIPSEVEGRTHIAASIRAAAAELARGPAPDTARLDAELLAAHLAGIDRQDLLLRPDEATLDRHDYDALIARRLAGEPVAHLTGQAEFWSLPLRVTADVLTPRPDSEALIELALAAREGRKTASILDLGTGSGCLLLAALSEFGKADGLGVDESAEAVLAASANAEALGLEARAAFLIGDWSAVCDGAFDLILCNPPYIAEGDERVAPGVREFEPAGALFAGADGLAAYRTALPLAAARLTGGGTAIFEIGAGQAGDVEALAAACGLRLSARRDDLGGTCRALAFARA